MRLRPASRASREPAPGRPPQVFSGYVVDLDGTVYLGDQPLPGAVETLARVRQAGSRLVFLTNNPLRSAASYAELLRGIGVQADEREVVTPLSVLAGYLKSQHAGAAVLTVAEPLVDQTLLAAGISVTTEPSGAGVVVVSFDRTFDYTKLLRAFRAVHRHGAVIIATNPDPFCPSPDGGLPDCAAMLAAVEACTGSRAEAVLGKPGPQMAAEVHARLGVPPGDAAMVGDRILTDVAMSRALRMTSILVLSGATAASDVAESGVQPDYVIEGIGDLLPDAMPQPARPREPQ
ncbi:MAG TPA: HAD-IIA family hydrolase [Streptosporangiaceae bacterium]|nr:HAD-IIA family hydrolase [Streptosporangiaceae bacterium]